MERPWFAVEPVDESFFEEAPLLMRGRFDVPLPAGEVWGDLTGEEPLHWCRLIDRIEWTSPRPYGVGTTRAASTMRGLYKVRETFFRWEEGRRKSFFVHEASLPLFRRFAEDYLVEPVSEAACTFTWTIAADPQSLTRPADPLNRRILATLFRDTREHYAPGPPPTH